MPQIIRFGLAALAGALVSQLWLTLAMIPTLYGYDDPHPLGDLTFLAIVEFPIILLAFALLGAPACLIARRLKLRTWLVGPFYGLVIGLIGSQAYISNLFTLYDFSIALVNFGLAGALGVAAFIFVLGKRNPVPTVSSASTPV